MTVFFVIHAEKVMLRFIVRLVPFQKAYAAARERDQPTGETHRPACFSSMPGTYHVRWRTSSQNLFLMNPTQPTKKWYAYDPGTDY